MQVFIVVFSCVEEILLFKPRNVFACPISCLNTWCYALFVKQVFLKTSIWKAFETIILWDENTAFQFIIKHFQAHYFFVGMDEQCSGALNNSFFQAHSTPIILVSFRNDIAESELNVI